MTRRSPSAVDIVLVVVLTVLTGITAAYAIFFLPWYIGVVPVPISAVVGAGVVFVTVGLCYALTGSVLAAAAPAVVWLLVTVVLATSSTLGYSMVIGDWRAMLLFGLGALAGTVAVASSRPLTGAPPDRPAADRTPAPPPAGAVSER